MTLTQAGRRLIAIDHCIARGMEFQSHDSTSSGHAKRQGDKYLGLTLSLTHCYKKLEYDRSNEFISNKTLSRQNKRCSQPRYRSVPGYIQCASQDSGSANLESKAEKTQVRETDLEQPWFPLPASLSFPV